MKTLRLFLSLALTITAVFVLSTCSEPEKPKPEIASIDPASGAVGDPVTITGKNLVNVQTISFGGITIPPASVSATEIITVVPEGCVPGATTVSVTSADGTSNSIPFEVLQSIPEITSIEPDKASVGMEVELKGKHFGTATSVTFGTKTITVFVSKTDQVLRVAIPEGLAPGALNVTVTADGGTSEKTTFTIVGKPTITKLTPAIGPVLAQISITGTYLADASKVVFNTGEAIFVVKNANLIEATVPTTATSGKVKVVTPGGEALSTEDYVIKDAPQVTSFTPNKGVVGEEITITGKSFDAGNPSVKFGEGKATAVTVVSATQIKAKVPNTGTTGKITVQTDAGSAQSAASFTVIGAPVVNSFTPSSGSANTEILIGGTNFASVSGVKFSGTSATTFTVVSANQIKANVPTGAASGKISVTTPSGTGTSTASFTVIGPPTITSFTPGNGTAGVADVTINGTNFTGTTSVKFAGTEAASFLESSAVKIVARVPASAVTGKITVTTPLGTATSTNNFNVTPFISSISPTSGLVNATVTITGTNMTSAKVKFGSVEATPVTNTATSITVKVPVGVSGAVDLTVVNDGGTSNAKTFTINSPVVIDEVIATKNIKGQLILVKGTELTGATKVVFGNVEAAVLTSTFKVVTAIIPSSLSVATYQVKVIAPKGTSNARSFEVVSTQSANTGAITVANGASVTALPAGAANVTPVANFWQNAANNTQNVQLAFGANTGEITVSVLNNFVEVATGTGIYDTNKTGGVVNNYIEFTVNGVRYVGLWSAPTDFDAGNGDCLNHITLISAESGKQLKLQIRTTNCN